MMKLNIQGIQGPWCAGLVLDWHMTESQCIGNNEFGHPIFNNKRTEVGELLYQFKYQNDSSAGKDLIAVACKNLRACRVKFDVVVPIPPSRPNHKVTATIADGLACCLSSQYAPGGLQKINPTKQVKSIPDKKDRKQILHGAFRAEPDILCGKIILIVDDLYGSGATLGEATRVSYAQAKAGKVYVFAVTRTR